MSAYAHTLVLAGPAQTHELGVGLAALLAPGDLVLMRGDLGVGKTTLTRAIARGLGITEPVTSPTFSLSQRYDGVIALIHVDAYRLNGADDEELGLLIGDDDGAITVIEWPDQLAVSFAHARLVIELRHHGQDQRLVALTADDESTSQRIATLVADIGIGHIHSEPERRDR
jgi:tRNA threonylcarbamoyladenosine biosynthesis protein TsaE